MNLTTEQIKYLDILRNMGITTTAVKRSELLIAATQMGLSSPPAWVIAKERKISHGVYSIPEIAGNTLTLTVSHPPVQDVQPVQPSTTLNLASAVLGMTMGDRASLIPTANREYVPWGHFDDIHQIISSRDFYTMYITGMSGNGKTTMIEQICADLGRECYRVNIIATTDEDDLIGGMRLIDGNTVWQDGPVVDAMKRGAVLLLDEIDLGTEKIMCLQSVLEGKGVYIKKQNTWVSPAKGFCVIATANTKGKGSDDGRFIGTNVMNEAFLDRFDYTYEQEYAPKSTEKKIITKAMKKYGIDEPDFVTNLVDWADITRQSFMNNAVSEIISTRRLLTIVKAYSVFKDKVKAVKMSLARFDKSTQDALYSLYTKVDGTINPPPAQAEQPKAADPFEPPF